MEKSSDGLRLADVRQPGVFLGSVPDGVVCLAAERGRILCPARRFRRGAIPPAPARHADPRKNALSTPGTPASGTIGGEGHECEARDGMLATLTDDELIWEIELAVEQANADVYDVAAIMELVALTDEADRRGLVLASELREQLREASSHE